MLRTLAALGALTILFSFAEPAQAADVCHLPSNARPDHCPSDDRIAMLGAELRENHVFFPRGGAALDDDARNQVALLSQVLNTQAMAGTCLRLVGHSDTSGGASVNMDISERRAQAVQAELQRMLGGATPPIQVMAMGEEAPMRDLPGTHVAQRRVTLWARSCEAG